jgi:hypothetical protein
MRNGTSTEFETAGEYVRVVAAVTNAAESLGKDEIVLSEFLPTLADLTASVGLATVGEKGLLAFIARIECRIAEWKAGTFPPMIAAAKRASGRS